MQALAMAINIARLINDLAKQAQGANGSKLSEILNGIGGLTAQGLGMMELAQRLVEANRDMTPEEKQLIQDADDAAADIQRRVLGAMNDESGDREEQQRRLEKEQQRRREAPEFSSARKAAEDRGKSR